MPELESNGPAVETSYLARLIGRLPAVALATEASAASYVEYLDRVLRSGTLTHAQAEALQGLARRSGLTPEAVRTAHTRYLELLARLAWQDGLVTEAERADLERAAELLGFSGREMTAMLVVAEHAEAAANLAPAPRVR